MTKTSMLLTAALAAASIAGLAQAQTTGATPATPATPPATAATPAPAAPATPAAATATPAPIAPAVAVGLAVKDNTGAEIGRIAQLKTDAAGKQLATIAMGADTFAVDTSSLAVDDGVATINLTAAQIQAMIKKPAAQ